MANPLKQRPSGDGPSRRPSMKPSPSLFFYRIVPSQRIEYQQPTEAGYRQFFAPSNIVGNYPVDFFESPFWFDSPFPVDYSFAYPLFGSSQLGRVDAPGETHNETWAAQPVHPRLTLAQRRSEEHTSELQSLTNLVC